MSEAIAYVADCRSSSLAALPLTKSKLPAEERWLLGCLIFALIVVSLPSKFLYFFGPILFAMAMLGRGEMLSPSRLFGICGTLLAVSSLSILIEVLEGTRVNPFGMLIWFVTHLPILLTLSARPSLVVSRALIDRLVLVLSLFVLVQAAVCMIPLTLMFSHGTINGDLVSGTFGILDMIVGVTINHVFFTLCMFCILVFLWPFRRRRIVAAALLAGAPVTILAQSGHQVFFFVFIILLMAAASRHGLSQAFGASVIGLILFAIMLIAYPNTLPVASMWLDKVLHNPNAPKRIAVEAVIGDMMTPKVFLIGTGLGQFSSRAALYAGGFYANGQLPNFMIEVPEPTTDHLLPAVHRYEIVGEGSAIAKPVFSVMSLPAEMGLPLTALLVVAASGMVFRGVLHARSSDPERQGHGRYMVFFITFVAINSTIENYLEFVQGMFLPSILLILAAARARTIALAKGESSAAGPVV